MGMLSMGILLVCGSLDLQPYAVFKGCERLYFPALPLSLNEDLFLYRGHSQLGSGEVLEGNGAVLVELYC